MKEIFQQKKEDGVLELPIEQIENNIDSTGVGNFLKEFNSDFDNVCSLVDKLNINLNKEERKNLLNNLINVSEKTVEFSTNFLNFKNGNLKINNSPLDLFIINEIHTLKNNLGSIYNFSRLSIEEDETEEEINSHFNIMKRGIRESSELLNKLKDVIYNGHEVNLVDVNLTYLTNDTIKFLSPEAVRKEINIENINKDNIWIKTDLEIVKSSLINLISNAIKFTEQGGNIIVSIDKDNEFIYINVKDDGVGVKKERQKDFFNNLGITTKGTNKEKGTGIGLYTISNILKGINSEISVYSDGEGRGSVFTIKLPAMEGNK